MSGVRAKVVKKKINVGNPLDAPGSSDLSSALNTILMGDLVDLSIAWPKYLRMRELLQLYVETYRTACGVPLLARKELPDAKSTLTYHVDEVDDFIKSHMLMNLSDYEDSWGLIEKQIHTAFDAKYNEIKKSRVIRNLFSGLSKIIEFKAEFTSTNPERTSQMKLGFIATMPGNTWKPFSYALDFGVIMTISGVGQNTFDWVRKYLCDYYKIVQELWHITQTPDVDIDEFSRVVESALDDMRHIPELSRCKAAFGVIKSSVGLLKENFGAYYSNFIDTNDPTSILHEFVVDVTKMGGNGGPEISGQMQTLIKFFRKQTAMRAAAGCDAKTSKLLQKMSVVADGLTGADDASVDQKIAKSTREAVVAEQREARTANATAAPASRQNGRRTAASAASAGSSQSESTVAARRAASLKSADELAAYIDS